MGSSFTRFVRRAINLYESNQDVAWLALENADDQICVEIGDVEKIDALQIASKTSMENTREAMNSRLLELNVQPLMDTDNLESRQEKVALSRTVDMQTYWIYRKEQFQRAHFEHLLDVLVWKNNYDCKKNGEIEMSRQEVFEFWGEEGISTIEECTDWSEIEKEFEHSLRSEPDFELYLLRKHLDWLDLSSGKIVADGPIPFRSAIPENLKLYIYEANWCNLYGFDAACASLCGAVLEEALRMKLIECKVRIGERDSLGTVIEIASGNDPRAHVPLLTPQATNHARKIMNLRNLTAHGKSEFASKAEIDRKHSLSMTIELLETLFSPEG